VCFFLFQSAAHAGRDAKGPPPDAWRPACYGLDLIVGGLKSLAFVWLDHVGVEVIKEQPFDDAGFARVRTS